VQICGSSFATHCFMKSRMDPLDLYVPLEVLTILSLIQCPFPYISTIGYPTHAVLWSLGLGFALYSIAVSNAAELITLRTHMVCAALIGIFCLGFSFISVGDATVPHIMFLAYGVILVSEATAVGVHRWKFGTEEKAEVIQLKTPARQVEQKDESRAA